MPHAFDISQLIFVIGFPRSGTSWFSNILNSHPRVVYRHEVLGRRGCALGGTLFRRLQFDHGLSEEDYVTVIRTVLTATVETDKPPFFRKRYRGLQSPDLQGLMWLVAHMAPFLARAYSHLYTPRAGSNSVLVIKETRSSVNLDSIISGVRADRVIVLVRHPYGVVASHLRGIRRGAMSPSSPEYRRQWLKANSRSAHVLDCMLSERHLIEMREAEFVALGWRVQNDDYMRIAAGHRSAQVIAYEAFLTDAARNATQLLESFGLETSDQVLRFVRESTGTEARMTRILQEYVSSDYFSVYRDKGFRANSWADVLSEDDFDVVDRHTKALVERLDLERHLKKTNDNPQHLKDAVRIQVHNG